jgi:uncharacterized protein (DUF305 family)
MRPRVWIGLGLIVVLAVLAFGISSVVLAQGPTGGYGWRGGGMMNGGMMGGMMGRGMMGGGMMNGGMMNGGMMGQGMMNGPRPRDPNLPFDLRFLDEMIAHHQGGVIMTQHMAVDSQRPEMRDLAQRIITAQQREIAQMQQWRQAWYPNAPVSPANGMGGMMGRGMMGGCPGMDADAMREMMGSNMDFDRMFLQMMIPHHEDAITLAEQALQQAEYAEIKTLAQTIITTQRAEIDEMRGYLRDWYGVR